jgi:DNA polymerase III subunit beta
MITITAKELTRALALCKMVTKRRNTIPVLGMVRLTASGNTLEVSATDLDNYMTVRAECECTEPLDVLLAPRVLIHFARHAQGLITIQRDGEKVKFTSGGISAEFAKLIPVEDWPVMREPSGATVTIGEAEFTELLHHTRPFISTEETRYYLNGVYLHAPEGKLTAAATDGHRIVEYSAGVPWFNKGHILPRKAAQVIAIAAKKGNGALEVTTDNDVNRCVLRFVAQDWTLTCKTIDGTFPDYSRVFPQWDAPKIVANVAKAAAMALTRQSWEGRAVKIMPDSGAMQTDSLSDCFTIAAPCSGHGGAFGLNLAYLQDVMRRHDTIRLEGVSAGDPFWIRTDNPKLRMVIMPMRVS